MKGPAYSCSNFKGSKHIDVAREFGLIDLLPAGMAKDEEVRRKKNLTGRLTDYEQFGKAFLDPKEITAGPKASKQAVKLGALLDKIHAEEDGGPPEPSMHEDLENAPGDFIWKAMRESFDPETNTIRDLKLDDRELERADNFYDFSTRVSGKSIKPPFARQLWISYNLLGEYCPKCTHPSYIHDVLDIPVDMDPRDLAKKVVFLQSGVCPKCGATKSGLIRDNLLRDVNQLAMAAGQRAGKSSFTATIESYLLHRYLKAPRLSTICRGIQDFTPLTFTFVGLTAGRAVRLLWNPFTEIIKASDWFRDYFQLMDHYGRLHGKEYYKDQVLFYRFFAKNIDVYPMGPVKRTLRGDTRLGAAVDEIGWFPLSKNADDEEEDDGREHANADEVYASLDNSLMTIRTEVHQLYTQGINHIPTGYMINISSPQSEKDKIMTLVRESEDPDALSLGVHLATWDISPLYDRNHPVIASAYKRNHVKAERDFGARPPSLTMSIFPESSVSSMFTLGGNSHRMSIHTTESDTDENFETIYRTTPTLTELRHIDVSQPAIMSVDAGLTNNSFTITVGHLDENILVIPTVLEVIPRKGTQIDFPAVYRSILKPLIESRNVHLFAADRWNSISILQSIADEYSGRVMCIQRTLNATDFNRFIASVNDNEFQFPTLEMTPEEIKKVRSYKRDLVDKPLSHLFLQFLTVKLAGSVLTKGDGYTDDILRSVAVMHSVAFNPKARAFLQKFKAISSNGVGIRKSTIFSASRGRV